MKIDSAGLFFKKKVCKRLIQIGLRIQKPGQRK